jgi:hypothetical protein
LLKTQENYIRNVRNDWKTFGNNAIVSNTDFEWFSQLKPSVEDYECSGLSSTCWRDKNMNKHHNIVNKDWQNNILESNGRCGTL